MPQKKIDWAALQQAFITDPERPTLENFCRNHKISLSTAKKRSASEHWMELRAEHWNRVGTKTSEKLVELQATIQARDIASQLDHLAKAKEHALKYAYGPDAKPYEDAGAAVLALDRITKLERLLLGESTENIKVDDMKAGISRLVEALRRKFGDEAVASLADEFEAVLAGSISINERHQA